MKVLVCGSRSITDFATVVTVLHQAPFDYTEIIHGGAIGVDRLAEQIAKTSQIPTKVYLPDWNTHGKSAGIKRNIEMVEACDAVIAIWDGKSKGTKFTIDYAKKKGKEVFIKQI